MVALHPRTPHNYDETQARERTTISTDLGTFVDASKLSADQLGKLLHPNKREMRAHILEIFHKESALFAPRYGESVAAERSRTWSRMKRLGQLGLFGNTITASGSENDIADARMRYDTVIDCVSLLDHSLEVKLGVSLGLFGSTVRYLGSDAQRQQWLPAIESMQEFGCFCLTELGHGSNARAIETTATYDVRSQSFILHTPTESAQKYWIGGAAESASLAVVFAQLFVNGIHQGVHAFVVRIRSEPYGPVQDRIYVEDCGVKAGLNGVDNGRIWFDRLKVPRENMLNRSSSVAPDGTYRSDIPHPDARFGAAMAALSGGRVGIAAQAIAAAKIGLAIAVRYANARRAFAPGPGKEEIPIMSYTSVQRRLMVPLATNYVYSFCTEDLRAMWADCLRKGEVSKELHVLSAGFKAVFSWYMSETLQHARECCGGQGYKSENRICVLRADRDVMLTFEGANDVMMQQVAKALLAEYSRSGEVFGLAKSTRVALDDPTPGLSTGITSPRFLRRALLNRELYSISALTSQVRRHTKVDGLNGFDAWNSSLVAAGEAARAHIDRRVYDMHVEGHIRRASKANDQCGAALRLCGELWALSRLDEDPSFLRHEVINSTQAKEVHVAVQALCARLTSIAPTLIDGFELPPHLLAPIAFDYIAHNARARL